MGENCRMEILYMDPDTYTAIATHEMRQKILAKLFKEAYNGHSMTKQELGFSRHKVSTVGLSVDEPSEGFLDRGG